MSRLHVTCIIIGLALAVAPPVVAQSSQSHTAGNQYVPTAHYALVGDTIIWRNMFGMIVGKTVVVWATHSEGCFSMFIGAPIISDTLPTHSCSLIDFAPYPLDCGTSEHCPNGMLGQKMVVNVECCLELTAWFGIQILCSSKPFALKTCPD